MQSTVIDTEPRTKNRYLAVASLLLAVFMNLLDVTIVNLALPSILKDLKATATELEWVLVIYVLTFAIGLLPFGRFGDLFGREKIFQWGVFGFIASSAICGFAPGVETLIGARALQGLSASMMVPQVLAIVHVIVPTGEKGKAIGLFGTVSGLGAVSGPLVGGAIVSANFAGLDWRPIFLINIPIGLVSLVGALRYLPIIRTPEARSPDWKGTFFFAAAVSSLIYPLIEGRHLGWPWWCFGSLIGSLIFGVQFLRLEARRADLGQTQLLPFSLLRNRSFVKNLLIVSAFPTGIAGTLFMLAIVLQSGFGLTPLQAGLATAPHPIGVMIASYLTTRFTDRWRQGRIVAGAAMLFTGMAWLRWIVGSATAAFSGAELLLPLLIVGMGMGTAMAPMFQNTLSCVPREDAGAGSGTLQAFQQVGIASGIAVTGQIFFHVLEKSGAVPSYPEAATAALWFPVSLYLLLILICLGTSTEVRSRQ